MLQQTNAELVDELQAVKDKNTKLQNDKKIEIKAMKDNNKTLQYDLDRSRNELQKLRDENFKMKKNVNDQDEKERARLFEIDTLRKSLEQEQRLGFEWRNKYMSMEENSVIVSREKEIIMDQQLNLLANLVEERKNNNIRSITFLNDLLKTDKYSLHSGIISMCLKDLNEYAAQLIAAEEELTLLRHRSNSTMASAISEFDLKRIERPKLSSSLFLLVLDVTGPPTSLDYGTHTGYFGKDSLMSVPPPGYSVPPPFNFSNTSGMNFLALHDR